MRKQFNKQYIIDNKGCYNLQQVNKLSFINNETISIEDVVKSEISLKDKFWFIRNKADLTLDERKELALVLAECVLEIYNKYYPEDKRVEECIKGIRDFNLGNITKNELLVLKTKCWDARRTADAAAAAYAAYAAAAAADAAAAAADAADAADAKVSLATKVVALLKGKQKEKTYTEKLYDTLNNFINNCKETN